MAKAKSAEKPATAGAGGSAVERLETLFQHWAKNKGSVELGSDEFKEGRAVVNSDPETKMAIVREIFARLESADGQGKAKPKSGPPRKTLEGLMSEVLTEEPVSEPALAFAADYLAKVNRPGASSR